MSTPKPQIRSHRDLVVYQRSLQLIKETYRLIDGFPKREIYGWTAQMRKAVISIPANIAEGHGRHATRDFLRFLGISSGSLREIQAYCDVSLILDYATEAHLSRVNALAEEVGKLLAGLRRALQARLLSPSS